jgi:hypothetical protein
VPNTPGNSRIALLEVNVRAQTARNIIIGFSRATPTLSDLWQQVSNSLSDIPDLTAEITRLDSELSAVRLDRANLAAAGRATLAAYRDRERDPLSYLRDELTAQDFRRESA